MTPPQNPNRAGARFPTLEILWRRQVELEHDHELLGQAGAVRLLGYRNNEFTGRFDDAIAAFQSDPSKNAAACTSFNYGSGNATAPDLCWVRRPNIQSSASGSIWSSTSPTTSGCSFAGCTPTGRPRSTPSTRRTGRCPSEPWPRARPGIAPSTSPASAFGSAGFRRQHAQYLAMGGVDGFVGDGHLRQAPEGVFDVFYSVNFLKAIWLTADYQHIWNPGFNADRGPVDILGGRVHVEF